MLTDSYSTIFVPTMHHTCGDGDSGGTSRSSPQTGTGHQLCQIQGWTTTDIAGSQGNSCTFDPYTGCRFENVLLQVFKGLHQNLSRRAWHEVQEGTCETWQQLYKEGWSLQVHQPQRFCESLTGLCAGLENHLGCLVGSNAYLTPPGLCFSDSASKPAH